MVWKKKLVRPIDIFNIDRIVNVVPFSHKYIFYNIIDKYIVNSRLKIISTAKIC